MEDLRESLKLRDLDLKQASEVFRKIAENLMCNHVIRKGDKRYAIVEIEFYLYSDKHRDYITYPRNVEEGTWFFHQSGVDLAFKSEDIEINPKYSGHTIVGQTTTLKKKPIFGGILIRGIYEITEDEADTKKGRYIFGPQKCVDELWDNFDAFNHSENHYPIIEASKNRRPNNLKQCKRHINIQGVEKQTASIKNWLKRLGLTESEKTVEQYREDLFDKPEMFRYRFFNMQRGEDKIRYKI